MEGLPADEPNPRFLFHPIILPNSPAERESVRLPWEFLFGVAEDRRRQGIGALQLQTVIREMEGGNPLPPQRRTEDFPFIPNFS